MFSPVSAGGSQRKRMELLFEMSSHSMEAVKRRTSNSTNLEGVEKCLVRMHIIGQINNF